LGILSQASGGSLTCESAEKNLASAIATSSVAKLSEIPTFQIVAQKHLRRFIAQRKVFTISANLACFASLRESSFSDSVTQKQDKFQICLTRI
jgi:hypothetical protein